MKQCPVPFLAAKKRRMGTVEWELRNRIGQGNFTEQTRSDFVVRNTQQKIGINSLITIVTSVSKNTSANKASSNDRSENNQFSIFQFRPNNEAITSQDARRRPAWQLLAISCCLCNQEFNSFQKCCYFWSEIFVSLLESACSCRTVSNQRISAYF